MIDTHCHILPNCDDGKAYKTLNARMKKEGEHHRIIVIITHPVPKKMDINWSHGFGHNRHWNVFVRE